jgi:ABC-type sugar transport system permease subunit
MGAQNTVPNNMVIAIVAAVVSFLMCCLPHGVISVIFAAQVNKKAAAGDIAGATQAAKNAKLWAIISIAVSVVWLIVGFAFGILGGIMSSIQNH